MPTVFYLIFSGALVSAILSTIDSALLAVGALVSRNLVPKLATRHHGLRLARMSTMIGGLIAFAVALSAEGIYALVEAASALGSSGVLVSVFFAYFLKWGGARSAEAALISGLVSLLVYEYVFELSVPYILSILTALFFYLAFALYETPKIKKATC